MQIICKYIDMKTDQNLLKNQLRETGLRATPSRLAVLQLLQQSAKPMDVSTIIESFPTSHQPDQATIYRILESFTAAGLVKKVMFDTSSTWYEIASLAEHHHAICTNCRRIEDIPGCPAAAMENTVLKHSGFASIDNHSVEFFGLCKACARA